MVPQSSSVGSSSVLEVLLTFLTSGSLDGVMQVSGWVDFRGGSTVVEGWEQKINAIG